MAQHFPFGLTLPSDVTGFDDLGRVRGDDGHILFALGYSCTLYVPQGDRPTVREGMMRAYERCLAMTGQPFVWGADPHSGTPEPIASGNVGSVRQWPSGVLQSFDFQMLFHGGSELEDADGYRFLAVSSEREEGALSFLSISLPVSWAAGCDPLDFVEWVRELATLVGPIHGYAGPTLIHHVTGIDDRVEVPYFELGKRFRGLDLDTPQQHEPYLSTHRIKPLGFLTVLDQSLVEQVAGQGLASWPAEWTHPYRSMLNTAGVVLQTGAMPRLGDTRSREPMPEYEQLSRLLESITETNPALIWPRGLPGMSYDEAIQWMRRFL